MQSGEVPPEAGFAGLGRPRHVVRVGGADASDDGRGTNNVPFDYSPGTG
jgi:hypothetical protein